jgi:hypothetical protein
MNVPEGRNGSLDDRGAIVFTGHVGNYRSEPRASGSGTSFLSHMIDFALFSGCGDNDRSTRLSQAQCHGATHTSTAASHNRNFPC